jgi:hypothetical protein
MQLAKVLDRVLDHVAALAVAIACQLWDIRHRRGAADQVRNRDLVGDVMAGPAVTPTPKADS